MTTATEQIANILVAVPVDQRASVLARAELTADNRTDEQEFDFAHPEHFDLDSVPPPPDYLVDGLYERRTVNITSGDTGSAKSIWAVDLMGKFVHGEEWFGRRIPAAGRVLYIDEENPKRVVHTRMKGLGITNSDQLSFRYYRRQGLQIGEPTTDAWLHDECEDFRPDLLIIDTAMAATAADAMDNDSVVGLYKQTLRPLAEQYDLAVIVLHHERKPGNQESRGGGAHAMMGARQWAGQADVHVVLTPKSEYLETPRDGGGYDTHKEFKFSVQKGRDGHSSRPELFTVRGVKEPHHGAVVTTRMTVDWGGRIEAESIERDSADRMLRHMALDDEAAYTRKEIATAMGEAKPTSPSGTFKRAWAELSEKNWVEKDGSAVRLTANGKEKAASLGLDL